MITSSQSYLDRLRKTVGSQKLVALAVRALILDPCNNILLVRRRDNLEWSLPTGGIELGESISSCLVREVKEETGLDVPSAIPIAIYSEPRFSYKDVSGNEYQLFCILFLVAEWQGTLMTETSETVEACFFAQHDLPKLPANQLEAIQDFNDYRGRLILK